MYITDQHKAWALLIMEALARPRGARKSKQRLLYDTGLSSLQFSLGWRALKTADDEGICVMRPAGPDTEYFLSGDPADGQAYELWMLRHALTRVTTAALTLTEIGRASQVSAGYVQAAHFGTLAARANLRMVVQLTATEMDVPQHTVDTWPGMSLNGAV